jgi:uncharacterized membrane protein YfcA
MRKSLIVVLVLSLLFAFLFAGGGAGIYGSPFAPVPANFPSRPEHDVNRLLMALTILVGPLGCGAALAIHRRHPRLACIPLVLGAIAGAYLGTTTMFAYIWEKVFLVTVWLPMIFVAFRIAFHPRRS